MVLRCTLEIIPGGVEDHPRRRTVGVVDIANVGGTDLRGDYVVTLQKNLSKRPGLWRSGRVENFPRQSLGPYDLLYRALVATVKERNKCAS